MPDNKYKEVEIVLVVCIILFLILAAIILLFLYQYQKRRFSQERELAEMQRQFQEQSMKVQLEIQEQTFHAISQEIHDNVGQILSLAKVQINIMNESDLMDRHLLQLVKENIGKAMTDLRDLARSMNSERIKACPLHDSLALECEGINRSGFIHAGVSVEGEVREIESQKKLILFRIIQEGIQNCLKHADATILNILFLYLAEGLRISIRDNGKGFDPEAALAKGGGSGLVNIKNRAGLTGGSCTIDSRPLGGTHITLNIPYE